MSELFHNVIKMVESEAKLILPNTHIHITSLRLMCQGISLICGGVKLVLSQELDILSIK